MEFKDANENVSNCGDSESVEMEVPANESGNVSDCDATENIDTPVSKPIGKAYATRSSTHETQHLQIECEEANDLLTVQSSHEYATDYSPMVKKAAMQNITGKAKCFICGMLCLKRNLDRHIRSHQKPFCCKLCTNILVIFNDISKFRNHMANVHSDHVITIHNAYSDTTIFQCTLCDSSFATKVDLEIHNQVHCIENGQHVCPICTMNLKSRTDLKSHMLLTHNIVHETLITSVSVTGTECEEHVESYLKFSNEQNDNDKFDKELLKRHKIKKCSVVLRKEVYLQQLFKEQHSSKVLPKHAAVGSEVAKKAGRKATKESANVLQNEPGFSHTSSVQIGSKKDNVCPFCKKVFKNHRSMIKHRRVHIVARLCHICSRSFRSKYSLQLHLAVVHCEEFLDKKTQTYKCSVCNRVYLTKELLASHLRRKHCGKVTVDKPAVVQKVKNVHQCFNCERLFATSKKLSEHSRSKICFKVGVRHNKETVGTSYSTKKQFKCSICSLESVYTKSIYRHLVRRHNINNIESQKEHCIEIAHVDPDIIDYRSAAFHRERNKVDQTEISVDPVNNVESYSDPVYPSISEGDHFISEDLSADYTESNVNVLHQSKSDADPVYNSQADEKETNAHSGPTTQPNVNLQYEHYGNSSESDGKDLLDKVAQSENDFTAAIDDNPHPEVSNGNENSATFIERRSSRKQDAGHKKVVKIEHRNEAVDELSVRDTTDVPNSGLHQEDHDNVKVLQRRRTFRTKDYLCPLCLKEFIKPNVVKQHLICVHQLTDAAAAELTPHGRSPRAAKKNEIEKCACCEQEFPDVESRLSHERCHTKGYLCPRCSTKFDKPSRVKRHLISFHKLPEHEAAAITPPSRLKKEVKKRNKEKCVFCDREFPNMHRRLRHEHCHTKPFECRICSTRFENKKHLVRHMFHFHKIRSKDLKQMAAETAKLASALEYQPDLHANNPQVDQTDMNRDPCKQDFSVKDSPNGEPFDESNSLSDATQTQSMQNLEASNMNSLNASVAVDPMADEADKCSKRSCPVCRKVFKNYCTLKSHLNIHYNPVVCKICSNPFRDMSHLKSHLKTHKKGVLEVEVTTKKKNRAARRKNTEKLEPATPTAIDKAIDKTKISKRSEIPNSQNELVEEQTTSDFIPVRSEDILPATCTVCSKKFKNQRGLTKHMKIHTDPKICPICSRPCRDFHRLQEHLKTHNLNKEVDNAMNLPVDNEKVSFDNNLIADDVSSLTAKSISSVSAPEDENMPSSSTQNRQCSYCSKMFKNNKSLRTHLKLHTSPKICSICARPCRDMSHLRRHMNNVHGVVVDNATNANDITNENGEKVSRKQMPYTCVVCLKVCSNYDSLKYHRQEHNLPQTCRICSKICKDTSSLNKHLQAHHGESGSTTTVEEVPKKLSCEICGHLYGSQKTLNSHRIRVHGSTEYNCPECGRKFKSKDYLRHHMRVHLKECTYVCELCGASFRHRLSFRRHSLVHSREKLFTCSFCDARFAHKSTLVIHTRIHTAEKPYVCEVCGKGFSYRPNLLTHQYTHTGEKQFECLHCGKSFTSPASRYLHIRNHHRPK